MIQRRSFLKGTAGVSALLVAGPHVRSAVGQSDSRFVLGSLEEPGSLSPMVELPHHFPTDVTQTLFFDSLTQFLPDATVGPKYATSWTVSDDELTYTFTLNPDARFHDDTPVTASDVVFTFEAILDPATNSSDEGLETVEKVTAIDDHTVEVVLSQVTPAFLAQAGARGIVPKHLLEGKDLSTDEFNRAPVGSGRYRFVSYTPGEAIVLEAVADHYRGTPTIQRVEFKVVTDQNVMLTQLISGELDYGLVTPRNLEILQKADLVSLVEVETPRFFDIVPNYERVYWQDANVRSAVLSAIDRESIVDSILLGHGVVVDANTTPASWAYTTDGVTTHPYDPDAAAAALDEAGWTRDGDATRSKDGESFAFTVTVFAFDQTLQQALLVAQQNLQAIGIDMQIDLVEPGVMSDRRSKGEYDALGKIWNPVYDPDQAGLLRTGNFYGYANAEVDALCDESLSTSDRDARLGIYAELQQVVSQDLPRLFLYSENELHVLANRVSGLAAHPVNVFWDLPTWSIN